MTPEINKLIYARNDSKYYIAGAKTRKEYDKILFWKGYYFTDILLKGKPYIWFFGNHVGITEAEFNEKVNRYLDYTFKQFQEDIKELEYPKFIVIYVDRPHACMEKTEEEINRDNLMAVMAGCNSGCF